MEELNFLHDIFWRRRLSPVDNRGFIHDVRLGVSRLPGHRWTPMGLGRCFLDLGDHNDVCRRRFSREDGIHGHSIRERQDIQPH